MIDVRNIFSGGLDLDSNLLAVDKSSYIDALNCTRDATAGQNDNVITNIVGNQLREYSQPSGTNKNIGSYSFVLRNNVIRFNYNSEGYHTVLQYSNTTKLTTKIFENLTDSDDVDILGFTLAGKITSVGVYPRAEDEGDLLIFIDSLGRPTIMNILRFINGEYTPVTRDIIDFHKRCPLSPPTCIYGNDATHTVNNTRNKLFRFCYMWLFDDFEKSTSSPRSAMPAPVNILDDEYTNISTNNNQITVSVNSGPQNVAKILLFVSWVNKTNVWSDFELVEAIDKEELSIADNTDYGYLFYNDATYPTADPAEMGLLFDYVPFLANCMDMPNGNVVTMAGITEGLDRDLDANVEITIDTVEAGGGTPTGSLSGLHVGGFFDTITFSGVPSVGTVVEVFATNGGPPVLIGTYTTVDGDTAHTVAVGIDASMLSIGIVFSAFVVGNVLSFNISTVGYTFTSLDITPPSSSADDNSIATWKWSTQRRLGLAYYNQKGVTNGVIYSTGITFPEYAEATTNIVDIPFINAKIFHVPPIWAYSYQWVITKEPTGYLYWMVTEVNDTESEYLYFNISNMALNATKNPTVAAVLSWTFQDGDRLRLIKRDDDDHVFDDTYDAAIEGIVVDPEINSVATTGTFVKIKQIPPFAAEVYSTDFFIIELYRPGQQVATEENEVYFEFGIQYPILNPTLSTRVHGGEVTDQSTDYTIPAEVNMYNGDSYFRVRTVYLSETGFGTFFSQDRNFVDIYISAVSSVDGRPLVIDVNQKETYFSATGRFGQAYQANTNVNGLNRFYPNNFFDCDILFGDIMRLAVNDRRIWVFQKFKTGQLPIFSQINKQPDGTIVNVVTDQLINPIDYYAGNWGIGTASTSLVIHNYAAYFCDNINGTILRLSKDGLTPISILYKVNSWANENLVIRNNTDSFIYGGYDQRLNNYIIALEEAALADSMVISFAAKFGILVTKPFIFALADNPNTGDAVTLQLTDGDGVIRTYSYTVTQGNTLTDIINSLYAQINGEIWFTASITEVFPEIGLSINQVTVNNPTLFSGLATLTYGEESLSPSQTLSFNEDRNSFESFLSFKPEWMASLGTLFIAFKDGGLWTHDSSTYNNFFGVQYESSITFVFNEIPLQKKTWMNLTQIASNTWDCPILYTNINSYGSTRQESSLVAAEFQLLEGMPTTTIKRAANSRGGKWNGDSLKGNYCVIKFRKSSASSLEYLSMVSVEFKNSPLTKS